MLLKGLDQAISILFADIFDAKVVNDKGEGDVTHHMLTESRGTGDRHISKLGEVYFKPFIGDGDGFFETRCAFTDLHIDPAVGADEATQVVLFNDLVQEEIQGEFHVLVLGHGGPVVEVFDVERHKLGVRDRYGDVEKTLRGSEAGAVGGGGASVVEYVAADGDTDTVEFGLVREDGGDHAGIGDLTVGGDAGFGHVKDSVGAARHASADALGDAAEIVGQAVAPYRLVGDLEKLTQIQGLAVR